MFKETLLNMDKQVPKEYLLLAQVIPILRLKEARQPPRYVFCWQWFRGHLNNLLEDDIFYILLRHTND
jgi:hypothetical protein